jgi:hypothetical protein
VLGHHRVTELLRVLPGGVVRRALGVEEVPARDVRVVRSLYGLAQLGVAGGLPVVADRALELVGGGRVLGRGEVLGHVVLTFGDPAPAERVAEI